MIIRPPVIPGRAEGANPESRSNLDVYIWIPGPLALRASRNDKHMVDADA